MLRRSVRLFFGERSTGDIRCVGGCYTIGEGPFVSSEVVMFAQFLQKTSMYSIPIEKQRASRGVLNFAFELASSFEWVDAESSLVVLQLLSSQKMLESKLSQVATSHLVKNASKLSLEQIVTTVLVGNSMFSCNDCAEISEAISRQRNAVASIDDVMFISKSIRSLCVLIDRGASVELFEEIANALAQRGVELLKKVGIENSSVFSEPISTLLCDVGEHGLLFSESIRKELIAELQAQFIVKLPFAKTHQIVFAARGLAGAVEMTDPQQIAGLVSRFIDRMSALLWVVTFSELLSFVDALRNILNRMQVREDVIDLETELSTCLSAALIRLHKALRLNIVSNPDHISQPSRQHHVQRQIPTRAELVSMTKIMRELGVCTPEVFHWFHGSLIDSGYKSEGNSFYSMGCTQSGCDAIDLEYKYTYEMDICRPSVSTLKISGDGTLAYPYDMNMNLLWSPFASKYLRPNEVVTTDFLFAVRQLQAPIVNIMMAKKARFFALATAIVNVLHCSDNTKLLGLPARCVKVVLEIGAAFKRLHIRMPKSQIVVPSDKSFESRIALLSLCRCYLLPVFFSQQAKKPVFAMRFMEKVIHATSEGLIAGLAKFRDFDLSDFRTDDLMYFASLLMRSNVLGDLPLGAKKALLEEMILRLPRLQHHELRWIVNVTFPLVGSHLIKRIECNTDALLMSFFVALKSECTTRLRTSLDGGISFLRDLFLVRCHCVALAAETDLSSSRELLERVVVDVIAQFKKQCTNAYSLIHVCEEIDNVFLHQKGNAFFDSRRKDFHLLILQSFSHLVKSEVMSFGNGLRVLRAFQANSEPKDFDTSGNTQSEIVDHPTFALHAELINILADSPLETSPVAPLPLLLDALCAVNMRHWRLFFKKLMPGFLTTISTGTLTQKAAFCEVIARTVSAHSNGKNRIPWAFSEYIHHHSASPRHVVNVLKYTSDRSFNDYSLQKIHRRVPIMPVYSLLTLVDFPALENSRTGSFAYYHIALRYVEATLGLISLRAHSLKAPEIVKKQMRESEFLSNVVVPFTSELDPKQWIKLVLSAEKFKIASTQHYSDAMTFDQFSRVVARSVSHSEKLGKPSDVLIDPAHEVLYYAALGVGRMREEDKLLWSDFHSEALAPPVPRPHSTLLRRQSVIFQINVGVLAAATLQYEGFLSLIKRNTGNGTQCLEGYLQLCAASTSSGGFVFIEKAPHSQRTIQSYRKKCCGTLKKLGSSTKRNLRGKVSKWYKLNATFVRAHNDELHVKASLIEPARILTAVSLDEIVARYGSVAACPDLYPYLRQFVIREMKGLPKAIAKGNVQSMNVFSLLEAAGYFKNESLCSKIMRVLSTLPKKERSAVAIRGLPDLFALRDSPQTIALKEACIQHLLGVSDDTFSKSISSLSEVVVFFDHSFDLLARNDGLRNRLFNLLATFLSGSDHAQTRALLKIYKDKFLDSAVGHELRLVLSRIPLYICNDLNQYSGSPLIDICMWLNNCDLLSQTTLDSIINKVECMDTEDDEMWIPANFDGEMTSSSKEALQKEKSRVSSALKSIVVKENTEVQSMDDIIE